MGLIARLFSKILDYPREILLAVDQKIGIEIFKISLVFSTVYFVQGMGGLSSIPLLFYFKDVLKFSEDQMQNFGAITMVAWLIKPLFGYISDRFPIRGYRRKSYMILMALVAAFSWWTLAWMVSQNYSQYFYLVLVFNFSSLGYAFVDVVCDGLMVERGQSLGKVKIFVNLQWFALGIAGFLANTFGGQLQNAVKTGAISLSYVFVIVGCVPLLTSVIAWLFAHEEKVKKSGRQEGTLKQQVDFSIIKEVVCSKIFWILSGFIFFWKFTPSFGAVFQYYSIDILKFDEIFLGKINAIGYVIFPLSILLYGGMLKWLPWIKVKHYLYGSIVVGLVSYVISLLFYVPENAFNWMQFSLPYSDGILPISINLPWLNFRPLYIYHFLLRAELPFILLWWVAPLLFLLLAFSIATSWRTRMRINQYRLRREQKNPLQSRELKINRILTLDKKVKIFRKIRFCVIWLILLPLSLILCLWFGGMAFSPFVLTYRSLNVTTGVIFGYLTIASWLIPLSLAGDLAPKKAEAMTYAYFMALSNVSGNFLPSIAGAQIFKILKKMLLKTETVIAMPTESLLTVSAGIVAVIFIIAFTWLIIRTFKASVCRFNIVFWMTLVIWSISCLLVVMAFASDFLIHLIQLKIIPVWLVQQSYLLLQPIIGAADFLGKEAYRALILRYSTFIGMVFILISIPFVYLLPLKEQEKKKN